MESPPPADARARLASLPRVDDLLEEAEDLIRRHGREETRAAVREAIDAVRAALLDGEDQSVHHRAVLDQAEAQLHRRLRAGPRRVVNAAGVMVHTNLGRAPLGAEAIQAILDATGYCDLEFDLASGRRGGRGTHVDGLLARATGAEAAMVVNNCAAALVLVLAAHAAGRGVVVSRGQLVEIGGSFRLPDIMASSGARLVEVGTTNRTRTTDYEAGEDVAALLTVHPSNFTQAGFVNQPPLAAVSAIADRRGIPHIHDAGSGLLRPRADGPLAQEPSISGALAAGAGLVLASGDKLLGGPQAGLVVGRHELVETCRRHPLARALRLDKLRLAALSATIVTHLSGRPTPVEAMLGTTAAPQNHHGNGVALEVRIAELASATGGEVVIGQTMIGGGSAPGMGVESPVVSLRHARPDKVAALLRGSDPPIVVRVEDGCVRVDLRTVASHDDAHVTAALQAALASVGPSASDDGGVSGVQPMTTPEAT